MWHFTESNDSALKKFKLWLFLESETQPLIKVGCNIAVHLCQACTFSLFEALVQYTLTITEVSFSGDLRFKESLDVIWHFSGSLCWHRTPMRALVIKCDIYNTHLLITGYLERSTSVMVCVFLLHTVYVRVTQRDATDHVVRCLRNLWWFSKASSSCWLEQVFQRQASLQSEERN